METLNTNDMKNILTLAVAAFLLVSCGGKIETEEKNKFEFGEVGGLIELNLTDGKYIPAAPAIPKNVFDTYCRKTWRLKAIKRIGLIDKDQMPAGLIVGKFYDEPLPVGTAFPFFALKDGGKVRQYIDSPALMTKEYKDGSYTYNPSTGILEFKDVVSEHPQLRIISIKEDEMAGSFSNTRNNSDDSVLWVHVYSPVSPEEEIGLDESYGAN